MLPIYFVIGLLNIFSQHHNYGIKIDDPDFDVRVRRNVDDGKVQVFNLFNNQENNLKRVKRYAYYKKIRITKNEIIPRLNNENNNASYTTRKYDIFNPNYNFLFNTTNNNRNNNTGNNRPMIINSYPYGYPPGYAPNSGSGTNRASSTTGYENNNAQVFYNYQNPDGKNFAGYAGYVVDKPGLVATAVPYTQKPLTNVINSNYPSNIPTPTTNNLPYATNLPNGVYNNNFNSIPKPFVKDNLSPYAPNFESANFANGSNNFANGSNNFANGSANFANGSANFTNGSTNITNGSYASVNGTNTTVTTTERIIVSGCVICNIPCPKFMRRFGRFCVDPDSLDDQY
ncbi:hypothetical protein PYW07_013445 [Mythimna separata]|uniref:Uncharacterized protein n=1 Tax=Mythimna separata TaxID=271217 RepID=A0AAD7Y6C6_MYTSE|nr:hypothetical protein PYW07_013445 [Mythimna separata]